jgi:hypothetical protein
VLGVAFNALLTDAIKEVLKDALPNVNYNLEGFTLNDGSVVSVMLSTVVCLIMYFFFIPHKLTLSDQPRTRVYLKSTSPLYFAIARKI